MEIVLGAESGITLSLASSSLMFSTAPSYSCLGAKQSQHSCVENVEMNCLLGPLDTELVSLTLWACVWKQGWRFVLSFEYVLTSYAQLTFPNSK